MCAPSCRMGRTGAKLASACHCSRGFRCQVCTRSSSSPSTYLCTFSVSSRWLTLLMSSPKRLRAMACSCMRIVRSASKGTPKHVCMTVTCGSCLFENRTTKETRALRRCVLYATPSSRAATHSLTFPTRLVAKCSMSLRRWSRSSLRQDKQSLEG